MKTIFLLLSTVCCLHVYAQTYQVGHITTSFTDSARSNRQVPVEIYYPADVAGVNANFAAGITGKVPAISFGHGFVMTYDAYSNIMETVVRNGYIIAFPTTEGSLSPSHDAFGKDLAFVLQQLMVMSNTPSSILFNKVDTQHCIMGHSMGGGASFLGTVGNTSVKAIVTFAAAETTPSAISAAANIYVPSLVFAGLNDCISPPAANQVAMYNGLSSSCKHYIGIIGGSHCQMANASTTCSFGENTCTPAPAISRDAQHAVIDTYLVAWLDHTLKGSCAAGGQFDARLQTDAAVTYEKNCTLCTTASAGVTDRAATIHVFPNPASDQLQVTTPGVGAYTLTLFDITGTRVMACVVKSGTAIPLQGVAPGMYIYNIADEGVSVKRGVLAKQ